MENNIFSVIILVIVSQGEKDATYVTKVQEEEGEQRLKNLSCRGDVRGNTNKSRVLHYFLCLIIVPYLVLENTLFLKIVY